MNVNLSKTTTIPMLSEDVSKVKLQLRALEDEEAELVRNTDKSVYELEESSNKLAALRNQISSTKKALENINLEEIYMSRFSSAYLHDNSNNKVKDGYKNISLTHQTALQRQSLQSQLHQAEDRLRQIRHELETKSKSLLNLSRERDVASTQSIAKAMDLRQSLLEISRDLEIAESVYTRILCELEVLHTDSGSITMPTEVVESSYTSSNSIADNVTRVMEASGRPLQGSLLHSPILKHSISFSTPSQFSTTATRRTNKITPLKDRPELSL